MINIGMINLSQGEARVVLEMVHANLESEVIGGFEITDTKTLCLLPDSAYEGSDLEEIKKIKNLGLTILTQME